LLIALACGAFSAGIVLLAVEMLTDPVASGDELERRVGAMTLAAVPFVAPRTLRLLPPEARHPAGYLTDCRLSAYADAFRNLRTSLRFVGGAQPAKVIAITSPNPNEGKTTCALSLARVSALAGQKVILIDCDSRRCALNGIMSISPEVGLWHVLAGQADWRSVAGIDDVTPAHILPSAPGEFESADMLSGGAMDDLLDEMRQHYDLVILDCPPVGVVADTRLLAAMADGVVLVSRWNKTPVREVSSAIRHLAPSGARLLGVVVNGVDGDVARWAGYGEYEFNAYAAA
jgi:capsular exopolysaccharide synthesis family protein